ncbi:AAA family ATPase [Hippea alviniae]|uniref:AAA family ATPase n=1 Tax=Hippea alviniae TaxID=1279027 RepID=UPI0003B7A417|nr:AAA family ATPase [Hippea alviniae]
MLKRIEIENFLTIEKAIIEPDEKITAIVGESGSGKSLILKTIESLFSSKTDTSFIGNFSSASKISLLFELNNKQKKELEEFGITDDEIVITKIIKKGKAKSYINHEPINQKILPEIKNILIDLVSQDYRFELFSNRMLLEILDRLVDKKILENFKKSYREFEALKKEKENIQDEINRINQEHPEILLEAIEKTNPQRDEYEELLNLSKQAKTNALSKETASFGISVLFEGENSVESILSSLLAKLEKLNEKGVKLESLNLISEALDKINLTRDEFYEILNKTFEQEEIDKINRRLFELEKLQRQFGLNINQIIKKREELKKLLKKKAKLENKLNTTEDKINRLFDKLKKEAEELTRRRAESALLIQEKIKEELKKLKLERSIVKVNIEEKSIDQTGKDRVVIEFTANPDLNAQPLEKVASGGEKSRFILALKKALTSIANTNETVFFDEIETGLSNTVLKSVLESIKDYSNTSQIILITHNLEVKELADKIYTVNKIFENNRTKSVIK